MKEFVYIVFFIIIFFVLHYIYRKNFKILKVPSVCLITGGVKVGKSLLSVNLSIKDYKRRHRAWWFKKHLFLKDDEEPLYYTNTTLSFGNLNKHKRHKLDKNIVNITKEHLLREYRFNYKSVIYINECSLLADNMDYNDKERNIDLSLFNKLIGHMTKGGALYYDTQSPLDSHYSIKRVCSTYFFLFKSVNFFLFRIIYLREMINTDIGVNDFEDDVEFTMRKVLVPFWYYHKYDRYEFEYLTHDLPLNNEPCKFKQGLVSFNPLYIQRSDKRRKVVNS